MKIKVIFDVTTHLVYKYQHFCSEDKRQQIPLKHCYLPKYAIEIPEISIFNIFLSQAPCLFIYIYKLTVYEYIQQCVDSVKHCGGPVGCKISAAEGEVFL